MKKYFAVLLALLLLCAAAPLAFATEMYDAYGDMDDWDEATWELSDSWTEEQWRDYWQGEEEAYARARKAELDATRQEMGLPNAEGVNVKLNDTFLTFANAWPVLENSTLFLPLRDFLAACGIEASISYDANTGVAHAVLEDGRQLTATLGYEELLAINAMGEEYEIYAYAAPKIINGNFYVEQWDLCEFLGLDAHWDYYNEILYIVDSKALIALLNKEFSIYNRLFSIANLRPDNQQAYRITGSLAFNTTLYGDTKDDAAQAVLEYDGLIRGKDADISFKMKLDFDEIKDTLLSSVDEDTMLLLKAISAGQGRLIVNSAEQAVYLQSNLLPLAGTRLSGKDWLKLEESFTMEDIDYFRGMLLEQATGMSIGRIICDNSYYYGNSRDFYANALEQAQMWQALIGDANFKQENRGGYALYTLATDQDKMKKTLTEWGIEWPGSDIFSALFGGYRYYYYDAENAAALSHNLNFREKDGQVTDFQLSATAQTGGYLPVTYDIMLEYSAELIKAHFEMKGHYGGKLSIDFNQQLTQAQKAPAVGPPANSRIIHESELDSQRLFW